MILSFEKINNIDNLMTSVIMENGNAIDVLKYKKLNESNKLELVKSYGNILLDLIRRKSNENYKSKFTYEEELIERTRGDIMKLDFLPIIRDSIQIFKNIVNNNPAAGEKSNYVMIIESTINNLSLHATFFEQSYKENDELTITLYRETVKSLIYYVALMGTTFVTLVKGPNKIYMVDFNPQFNETSIGFEFLHSVLNRFNTLAASGKLNNFFIASRKYENFADIFATGATLAFGVIIVVFLLREMIYFFFYARVKISDYLRYLSTLIEMNKASKNVSKNVISEQNKYITVLNSLADAIDIDVKLSVKSVSNEIKKEKKLNDIKDTPVTDSNYF